MPKTTKAKYLDLIADLRHYAHAFLTKEGALHFSKPFGFEAQTYVMQANPTAFKGLTLANGAKEAEGIEADVLAEAICDHLRLTYASKFGRGSQLCACCDALEEWANSL